MNNIQLGLDAITITDYPIGHWFDFDNCLPNLVSDMIYLELKKQKHYHFAAYWKWSRLLFVPIFFDRDSSSLILSFFSATKYINIYPLLINLSRHSNPASQRETMAPWKTVISMAIWTFIIFCFVFVALIADPDHFDILLPFFVGFGEINSESEKK